MTKYIELRPYLYANADEVKSVNVMRMRGETTIHIDFKDGQNYPFCSIETESNDLMNFALEVFINLLTDSVHPVITKALFAEYFTDVEIY